MTDFTLDRLLARARGHRTTDQELREQRISFVVGNVSVERQALHRGTVTMAVPRSAQILRATVSSGVGRTNPIVPFDVYGSVRQFHLVQALVERNVGGEPVLISPELILELHAAASDRSNSIFGAYREVAVEMRGSPHRPPSPASLAEEVTALCDYICARWHAEDAIALSAYVLWRLNWIHPFLDGNGRTARALCYLVLNLKLDMLVPGSPTLPEQLTERRGEYFDALTTADISFAKRGEADLTPLKQLLETLLIRQLRSMPAQSRHDEAQLAEIVERRVGQLDLHLRERIFGSAEIAYRAWSIADVLLVHVGPKGALNEAEALFSSAERPFPGLLATPGEPALLTITARQRGAIVRPRTFEVTVGAALWLEHNAAVVVECPAISIRQDASQPIDWALDGALYVLRRGDEITELWAYDIFDLLVTRHIQEAR